MNHLDTHVRKVYTALAVTGLLLGYLGVFVTHVEAFCGRVVAPTKLRQVFGAEGVSINDVSEYVHPENMAVNLSHPHLSHILVGVERDSLSAIRRYYRDAWWTTRLLDLAGRYKFVNINRPVIRLYCRFSNPQIESWRFASVGDGSIYTQRDSGFEFRENQVAHGNPSPLFKSKILNGGINRSLGCLYLFLGSSGARLSSGGSDAGRFGGLHNHIQIPDVGESNNRSDSKGCAFYRKPYTVAAFCALAGLSGFFVIALGLRVCGKSDKYWWPGFLITVVGCFLCGCGVNAAAYFLYVGTNGIQCFL